jgi:prephenate dehydrogenase
MEDGFSLRESTIGIIGLGLMGGSLAMGLKGKCARLIGFDSHPPTLELALSKNIIDHAEAIESAGRVGRSPYRDQIFQKIDVLILATPVPTIINTLQQLPSLISHPCIVMDMGSTKRDTLRVMLALPDNFDPIGGHPICGKEKLGLENADESLYQGAPFVITSLERTSKTAKSAARQIISAVGANLVEMTAEEHDRILASTSHMPFLLSSALARSTPQEFASLIGPGFRSTARLAGTPSHMMVGILKSNRDNVLNAIHSFRVSLDEIESALQNENYPELQTILNESRKTYPVLTADRPITNY